MVPDENLFLAKFLPNLFTAAFVLQKIIPFCPSLAYKKWSKTSNFSIGSTTVYWWSIPWCPIVAISASMVTEFFER